LNYRADIDGLRAIAVLSVVIFHLDVSGFQGGYVGVDVFFVISGYLITSIILRSHEDATFRMSTFYARRIRRLVPPLLVTVALTLVGAALVMTPDDLIATSRSAAAAIFSLSNFVFYAEAGYWDTASELKPLLHTWSLGVEEQFYLFWPTLVIALLAIRRRVPLGGSLAAISLCGAALCIWYTSIDQSAAFYLLPFRVFQFAVGAALIPLVQTLGKVNGAVLTRVSTFAFWPGLFCIAASVATFGDDVVFPGVAVLLPTLGTALVLASGAPPGYLDAPARALMQNPVSVWLGRVSYSMYLVHWPLIVLFRYQYGLELSLRHQVLLGAGTLLATCGLHYGVERRFYRRGSQGAVGDTGRFVRLTAALAVTLALVSSTAWLGDGWAWRFAHISLSADDIEQGKQDRFQLTTRACTFARDLIETRCNMAAKLQVLVLGNSAEVDGFNFLQAAYGDDADLNLMLFGSTNRCARLRAEGGRYVNNNATCQKMLDTLFDPDILSRLDIVLYAANQPYSRNKSLFLDILRKIKAANPAIKVVTFGGYINTRRPCAFYINKSGSTDACAFPENVQYFPDNAGNRDLSGEFRKLESYYIDRVGLLCENRELHNCRTRTERGVPALYDNIHTSFEFAQMSGKMYAREHPDLLRELAAQ